MRGASTPFQFRSPRADDYVEEEMSEDGDMLFITSRQGHLEEQIQKLQKDCDTLLQVGDRVLQIENPPLHCA